jgi:tRNA pseudouridine55 synthase
MKTNNGLLLIDKPEGITSHDVVSRVRRALGEKRVGHAGTLDPMATGLLIIGVGPATRLIRFAQSEKKLYTGVVKLGSSTDSLDADGEVTGTADVPELSLEIVQSCASSMLGTQQQIPPMVSAIKVGGKRLYEMAREGIEIERAPRQITISRFEVCPTESNDDWNFVVECTVGTYIRVLLSDLAVRLGTLGHLTALRREASGHHSVKDAFTLDALKTLAENGTDVLRPPVDFVTGLETVSLNDEQERRVRMGQQIEIAQSFTSPEIAALDVSGQLVAILQPRGQLWKPELVLPDSSEGKLDS